MIEYQFRPKSHFTTLLVIVLSLVLLGCQTEQPVQGDKHFASTPEDAMLTLVEARGGQNNEFQILFTQPFLDQTAVVWTETILVGNEEVDRIGFTIFKEFPDGWATTDNGAFFPLFGKEEQLVESIQVYGDAVEGRQFSGILGYVYDPEVAEVYAVFDTGFSTASAVKKNVFLIGGWDTRAICLLRLYRPDGTLIHTINLASADLTFEEQEGIVTPRPVLTSCDSPPE